jgi:hypothetical protein
MTAVLEGEGAQSQDSPRWSPLDYVPDVRPEALPPDAMKRVRFGRSAILRKLAAATFGAAITSAIKASPALATCNTGTPPPGCTYYGQCCCCSLYSGCCLPNCTTYYSGCGSNGDGWYRCYNGLYIFCGDYWVPNSFPPCSCRFVLANC